MQVNIFQIGSIVTINSSFLGETVGVKAYVYEHYRIGSGAGISIITENGVDLGGFNVNEQAEYLAYWNDTNSTYHFKNVMQLKADFDNGLFAFAFTLPKRNL